MRLERHLQAFIAIAERGKLVRAAEDLNLAQSSLTKRLTTLETELGVALFKRVPRGVELTEYGKVLYPRAKAIQEEVRRAAEDLAELHSGAIGRVHIGAGAIWNIQYMPTVIAHFKSKYPKIEFKISTGTNDMLLPMLERGDLDLALTGDSITTGPETLKKTVICSVDIHVVAHVSHPVHSQKNPTMQDLEKYPWIVYHSSDVGDRGKVFEYDDLRGFSPNIAATSDSWMTGILLASSHNYLMTIPSQLLPFSMKFDLAKIKDVPVVRSFDTCVWMRTASPQKPIFREILDYLEQLVSK